MDSIGGLLNPIGKMPKTHYKMELFNGFTGKSYIFFMETIGISVMVSQVKLSFIVIPLHVWTYSGTKGPWCYMNTDIQQWSKRV